MKWFIAFASLILLWGVPGMAQTRQSRAYKQPALMASNGGSAMFQNQDDRDRDRDRDRDHDKDRDHDRNWNAQRDREWHRKHDRDRQWNADRDRDWHRGPAAANGYRNGYRGVLAPEWQQKYDSYYQRWLNYRATNNQSQMRSMEGRMQSIMRNYNIPSNTPYGEVASGGR